MQKCILSVGGIKVRVRFLENYRSELNLFVVSTIEDGFMLSESGVRILENSKMANSINHCRARRLKLKICRIKILVLGRGPVIIAQTLQQKYCR